MYFGIGEVAKMYDVNTSLLRFWEKEFDVLKPKKNRKGDRFFTQKDMKYIKVIYHLVKEKGYTLKGAKKYLKDNKEIAFRNLETIESLNKIRNFLVDLESRL